MAETGRNETVWFRIQIDKSGVAQFIPHQLAPVAAVRTL